MYLFFLVLVLTVWVFKLQSKIADIEYSFEIFKKKFENLQKEQQHCIFEDEKAAISSNINDKNEIEVIPQNVGDKIADDICELKKDVIENENFETERVQQNTSDNNDVEKTILGNIFNKIGAGAIVVAFCIFIKVFSVYFIKFTPVLQIITGIAAGLAMIFSAAHMMAKNLKMKNFSEVLLGTGFAILFTSTYCSTAYYHLITTAAASFFAILLLTVTYFISKKCNSFATLLIGLLGGYINVFFMTSGNFGVNTIDSNIVSINFIFGYLIFLNLVGILYVFNNSDKAVLNFINLAITAITVFLYSLSHNAPILIFPLILWGAYIVNDLLLLWRKKSYPQMMKIVIWTNFIILYLFTVRIFGYEQPLLIGSTISFAALIYGIAAKYFKSKDYLYGLLTAVLLASYYLFDPYIRVYVLSFETVLLAYFYRKSRLSDIKNWLIIYSGILLTIFFIEITKLTSGYTDFLTVFYMRALLFGAAIISIYLCAKLLSEFDKAIFNLLQMVYISLCYLWIVMELTLGINYYRNEISEITDFNNLKVFSYVITGFIYSLQMNYLADKNKADFYPIFSNLFCFLSLSVLLIYGIFASVNIPVLNIRAFSFVFAIITLLYLSKHNKNNVYIYSALLTGIWAISLEMTAILAKVNLSEYILTSLTAVWLIYAGIITVIGIFKNLKPFTRTGILITAISIIKIFICDLVHIEPFIKIIIFLLLGAVLMFVSYFYNKLKH